MTNLKRLSPAGVPSAVQKAERYRLLNQPWAAESICLDVLGVEAGNQQALVLLLLCITDQFGSALGAGVARAREVLHQLTSEYQRTYYAGIICERRGQAQMVQGGHGAESVAYSWFREAMDWYEKAEAIRPAGNDESLLRWNTCARLLAQNPKLAPRHDEAFQPNLGE
ncbi:MAG: hypothetical protein ABI679_08195 [Gemmatimonadota bacterium]